MTIHAKCTEFLLSSGSCRVEIDRVWWKERLTTSLLERPISISGKPRDSILHRTFFPYQSPPGLLIHVVCSDLSALNIADIARDESASCSASKAEIPIIGETYFPVRGAPWRRALRPHLSMRNHVLRAQNAETYTTLEVTFQMRTEIIVSTNMREQVGIVRTSST